MRLKSIKYIRNKGQKSQWSIGGKLDNDPQDQWVTLETTNLIVGLNATGKTKTINIIRDLADLFCGEVEIPELAHTTSDYYAVFENLGDSLFYHLKFKNGKVLKEKFVINFKEVLLNRGHKGVGTIFHKGLDKALRFQTPETGVAVVSRRDAIQHPFFENLYQWGKNLSHYKFGSPLGKDAFETKFQSGERPQNVFSFKNSPEVVAMFRKGKKSVNGEKLTEAVKSDMEGIGYYIKNIGTQTLKSVAKGNDNLTCLYVDEDDIPGITDQNSMSQGMFRALSLIIQLNYSLLTGMPSCILIDDIGEGLDYDRSKSLIDLIIEKSQKTQIQVIMSTNNRFVMNKIPLKYWSLIKREGNKSVFYNYKNSADKFEDFKYTGLNNFDFFSTDFYIQGFKEEK